MRRVFVILYVVTFLVHVPFAVAVFHIVKRVDVSVAVALLLACAFHHRLQLLRDDRPISRLRRILEEVYFVHWSALLLGLPFLLIGAAIASAGVMKVGGAMVLGYLLGVLMAVWGVCIRRRMVRIREIDVRIDELPASFEGYRICQLSDLHIGSYCTRERAEGWVRRANAIGADLVALTGDYVTSGTRFHDDIAAVCCALTAPDGVVAVFGNHDYYGDGEPLLSLLREGGVIVLRNELRLVERDTFALCVAGVDDRYTKREDVERVLAAVQGRSPSVVLAHDPRAFEPLADGGADLVLSGHTHWGQIALPFMAERFNYASSVYDYHAGAYRRGRSNLYVSPGLGTTGPPIRLGTWPEISVLTLRRAEPSPAPA